MQLAPDSTFAGRIAGYKATATGDVEALLDPRIPLSAEKRTALVAGYRAMRAGDAGGKAQAVQALVRLPEDQQNDAVAMLLADLGATQDAFRVASRLAAREYPGPSIFWYPSLRPVLSDPRFPAVAEQLGLMRYWKATRTKPDVCRVQHTSAPFCGLI